MRASMEARTKEGQTVTSSDDQEFASLIESAYTEPLMVTGAVGDEELTEIAPTTPRVGTDLGVAGSLIQARAKLRREWREEIGVPWRDGRSVAAAAVVVISGTVLGILIARANLGPLTFLAGGLLIALAGGALWALWVRHGPIAGERNLTRIIVAEQRAGRELTAALAGSAWVLLHDRRLPQTEHRVPFLAVGPGGIAVIAILPAGPYRVLTPVGLVAGDDELGSAWLPARIWEARFLMRRLSDVTTRDLRFTGPVLPIATEGYPKATKRMVPDGWSADPPHRIDKYQIRRPAALGRYLQYLPTVFAPHHVTQLAQLVNQHCEPAPWPERIAPAAN